MKAFGSRLNAGYIFLRILPVLMACFSLKPAYSAMAHDRMIMDEKGMIMNANHDELPKDCPKLAGDIDITIRAGHKHAEKFMHSINRNGMSRRVRALISRLLMMTTSAIN